MKMQHPGTGAIYQRQSDGTILVTARNGKSGHFDRKARHLSGELKFADQNLCLYVSDGFRGGGSRAISVGLKTAIRGANLMSVEDNIETKKINYQSLLDADTRPVPEIVRKRGDQDVGPREIPTSWYLDRKIHEQEIDRIWKKKWQMACRADDLAEVGDTWVYRIVDISILLVRSSSEKIQGFYNSCLHRGRTLRECPGNVAMIQCPFHGFTWSLSGRLKMVPSRAQFPQIESSQFRLPEVKVALWGGFVFVNPDLDAEPLEDFLGDLPSHFERWPLDKRVKVAHVHKRFNCNWKLAQEAFLEGYHANTTHPQMMM